MWIVERRFKIQLNRKFSSAIAAAAVTATATDRKKKYSIQLHIIGRDDAQQLKHVCASNFISLFFAASLAHYTYNARAKALTCLAAVEILCESQSVSCCYYFLHTFFLYLSRSCSLSPTKSCTSAHTSCALNCNFTLRSTLYPFSVSFVAVAVPLQTIRTFSVTC